LLKPKPTFDVSEDDVKTKYKKLMGKFHPDIQAGLSPKKDEDETQATTVTDVTRAYSVLKDPHERALHLLELNKNPMKDDEGSNLLGQDFLAEIMELRMGVDNINDDQELKQMMQANTIRITQTCDALRICFDQCDYDRAKRLTAELRYWTRIEEQLKEKIDDMD